MPTCCKVNLTENARQKLLLALLGFEGVLVLIGIITMSTAIYIRSSLQKYFDAIKQAESGSKKGGYQTSTFNYILSVGVMAILLHFGGTKLFYDSRDWRLREKYKYGLPISNV